MINYDASVEVKVWVWWFCDWREDGKLKATTSPLATVHTGVKPHFGSPQLKIHWTNPRQGWCPAQQPWECSRGWRGLFWWIQQVCHQDLKFTFQDSNFNFSQCFILFFQNFFFIWSHPKWFSLPFTFNCNSSINIVNSNFMFSLKMSDEG